MEQSPTAILTDISHGRLECTYHCHEYHCLLSLRAASHKAPMPSSSYSKTSDLTVKIGHDTAKSISRPDISSLGAIPILVDEYYSSLRESRAKSSQHVNAKSDNAEKCFVPLLPKLYNNTRAINDGENDNGRGAECSDGRGFRESHPCRELISVSKKLESQLSERLSDASDGAVSNDRENNSNQNPGIYEEFLLRSEAIFMELLSAVQQQIRRDKSSLVAKDEKQPKTRVRTTQSISTISSNLNQPPMKYYSALLRQLEILQSMPEVSDITLHKSVSSPSGDNTTDDLTRISVTSSDKGGRSHTWNAELYPNVIMTVDLPAEFVLEDNQIKMDKWWEHGSIHATNSVKSALPLIPRIQTYFLQMLDKYQLLFEELDDLDSHLWILEPSLPARRCSVERRIALWEGGASMVIVLDPERPRGVPVLVRFLGVTLATMKAAAGAAGKVANGNEEDVIDWRVSFARFASDEVQLDSTSNKQNDKNNSGRTNHSCMNNVHWSEGRSVRENLELWFGSSLPSPHTTERSDYLVECGICYAHRLPAEDNAADSGESSEGPLPEEKCSNPSCNRHYHESCLFEWLHSLPTARVSFDRIFGSCPYCYESVSVKIVNGGN